MRAGISFIKAKFDEFNRDIFALDLPTIPIAINKGSRQLGGLYVSKRYSRKQPALRYKMVLSDRYDFSQSQLEDIIIHEMIHLAIDYSDTKDNGPHGDAFKSLMRQINSIHGRNISVRFKLDNETRATDKTMTRSYIITFKMKNRGEAGFMRCASTFVFEAHRCLERASDICDIKLYGTFDPYFAR